MSGCTALMRTGYYAKFSPCGKPIARDGLCGLHASAADRRRRNYEVWRAKMDKVTALRAEAEQLSQKLGITVVATSDDSFIVPADWLRALQAAK